MRRTISLNRGWLFGKYEEDDKKNTDEQAFQEIEIPHSAVMLPLNNFNEEILWGKFIYINNIKVEDFMRNQHVILRFEGAAHRAEIYINNEFILTHDGGYIPFEVDLSTWVNTCDQLDLRIILDTQENPGIPPFGGVVDYLGYGGIYREVYLIVTDLGHIEDLFIEQYGKPNLKAHIKTSIEGGTVELIIYDQDNQVIEKVKETVHSEQTTISVQLENPHLWDLDDPYLYKACAVYQHHDYRDEYCTRFGLREAIFKRDGFYLNQKKIKLHGLNRHQSYPYVGYAMPKSAQEEDADIIRFDLGCNIVRTSHYPQSKHFLNRCDEIGLLVLEEIPGWQHIGDEAWQNQSINNLDIMIERDRNHPSIILWGVRINESQDNDSFYQKTNAHAMALDPTRQRGGVRNFSKSHFFENVYTYNDFSHYGPNKGLEKKEKIAGDVPYLVTEFNGHMYPTKSYDDELHRVKHLKRHLNVLNEAFNLENNISGAIGWVFADYNTHKEFGSGDRICYHGVMDMFRIPKYASLAYATIQDKYDLLEIASTMNLGEYPAGNLDKIYVLTNLDEVKLYKNDLFIKTFKPHKNEYPNLPHPPVIIDDFIGESLKENEKLSERDAELTKKVLRAVSKYGNHLPLRYKLYMLYILKKYKKTYDDAVKLFYTYMTGWGAKQNTYRFEGYKNGELIKVVHKEPIVVTDLILEHNGKDLKIEDTYDVKRFILKKVDQNGHILPYAHDALSIETTGVIEIIGSKLISLQSGVAGFWVKASTKGLGTIVIKHEEYTIIEEVNVI